MLNLDGVAAFYQRSQVLRDVSLQVETGQIVAVLGRNGMGKTTLLKTILGLVERRGEITFAGRDLTKLPPHRIARLGISYLPQGERLFPGLTLRENLALVSPDDLQGLWQYFPELAEKLHQRAGTLSGGEQQLAALVRVLLSKPKLLLLDEPSEGLSPVLIPKVEEVLLESRRRDAGLLLVEQRVGLVLRLADRICILEEGRMVWTGRAEELGREELEQHLGI